MNLRAAYLLQVLEKIGAPLVAAVDAVALRGGSNSGATKEAERVAELLVRSVQVSVALSEFPGLRNGGDSGRLALAALGAQLAGGHYRLTGKVPAETDIKRLTAALGTVLTFSDNFAVAADNIARLENLEPGGLLADAAQINIRYVGLFVPVVTAIARFPFNQPENTLAQDVAGRLMALAAAIRKRMPDGPGMDEQAAGRAELNILHGLAALYAACHNAETDRLMALDAATRKSTQSLDAVWKAFETGAAMLEAVAFHTTPGVADAQTSAGGEAGGPQTAPAAAPTHPPAAAETPPPAADDASAEETGYNPMSFFKPAGKKSADG